MDGLSLASDLVRVIGLAASIYTSVKQSQRKRLVKNYGPFIGLPVSTILRDTTTQYERIECDILNGSDQVALSIRQTVTDECNVTAVAVILYPWKSIGLELRIQGAIIAQVAITGLSLPNFSSTHWVARACFLLAVVSGCLSVYYACVFQRLVGKLYTPSRIRNWIRLPPSISNSNCEPDTLSASLTSVFIVSAPFTMVKVSIFAFLLGLGNHQGFIWTRNLDTSAGRGDSRNAFISLMSETGFCYAFFSVVFAIKNIENLIRTGTLSSEGTDKIELDDQGVQNSQGADFRKTSPPGPRDGPIHTKHGVDTILSGDLAAALMIAARAHIQCAEADQSVAFQYARMSNHDINTTEQA